MYLIQLGPTVYEKAGGGTFTLVEAVREVYGCRAAYILREDGTVAVENAGSAYSMRHAPTGLDLIRRPARRGVVRWRPPIDRAPKGLRPAFEVIGVVMVKR